MRKLPRRAAPFVYGLIQAAITTGVATAISAVSLSGRAFLSAWLPAWGLAWITMIPIVLVIAPMVQRAVMAVTDPT
jgi:hypothetical protein